MGLPIRFCQEGFLGHNYQLRPMLYILGDKSCQTQGSLLCESTSQGRTTPPGPGVGGGFPALPQVLRRDFYHCLLLTPSHRGRSDTRVSPRNLLNSLLSAAGAPLLSLTPQSTPPPLGGGGLLALLLHPGLSGVSSAPGGEVWAAHHVSSKSVLSRINLIR